MFKSNPERPWSLRYLAVATALATAALAQPVLSRSAQHGAHPHKSDHILIADQFNNRIIEIDRATHAIVWQFGDGFDTPSASSIVGPNDAAAPRCRDAPTRSTAARTTGYSLSITVVISFGNTARAALPDRMRIN